MVMDFLRYLIFRSEYQWNSFCVCVGGVEGQERRYSCIFLW